MQVIKENDYSDKQQLWQQLKNGELNNILVEEKYLLIDGDKILLIIGISDNEIKYFSFSELDIFEPLISVLNIIKEELGEVKVVGRTSQQEEFLTELGFSRKKEIFVW